MTVCKIVDKKVFISEYVGKLANRARKFSNILDESARSSCASSHVHRANILIHEADDDDRDEGGRDGDTTGTAWISQSAYLHIPSADIHE